MGTAWRYGLSRAIVEDNVVKKASTAYWVICILLLLLNGFGGYDYTMIRLHDRAYLADMGGIPSAILQWYDAYPLWANVVWATFVWPALAGAFLLLGRSRHAVTAFLISAIAAVLNIGYHLMTPLPAEMDTLYVNSIPFITASLVFAQLWYARRKAADGTLR